jgi:hypothetical protein
MEGFLYIEIILFLIFFLFATIRLTQEWMDVESKQIRSILFKKRFYTFFTLPREYNQQKIEAIEFYVFHWKLFTC